MRDKLKRIPASVAIAAAVGVVALAGFVIVRTVENYADGSFHFPDMTPEEWAKHRAEMMKKHGGGGGMGGYRTSGAPDGGNRNTR